MASRSSSCWPMGLVWVWMASVLLHHQGALAQDYDCSEANSCSECLDVHPACQWCSDRTLAYVNTPRCSNDTRNCTNATQLHSEPLVLVRAEPISDDVEVSPQLVTAKMRAGDTMKLQVQLRRAPNYPLDVYYLMDHTLSFESDLQVLQNDAEAIVSSVKLASRNARLGFGAFVDKPIQPYVITQPQSNELRPVKMCANCTLPYAFENAVPLNDNETKFVNGLTGRRISASLDRPEGTFEAMMQVLVCPEEIGWRPTAHRVLIVATDTGYHAAGDGRLAGIALPNDGRCHLDADGTYSAWNTYDYPSLGQINNFAQLNSVNIIFAIKDGATEQYNFVRDFIQNSVQVSLQETNTVNSIRQLLISSLSNLRRDAKPSVIREEGVRVTSITAQCSLAFKRFDVTDTIEGCQDVFDRQMASFEVTIQAGTCSELKSGGRALVRIPLYGDVEIEVEGQCQCACQETPPVLNSTWCTTQGAEQCGLCNCRDGFSNKNEFQRCECDERNQAPCIQPGTFQVCSGRGRCECGTCECEGLSNGTYCECDNGNCEVGDNGLQCSGSGECVCGTCRCNEGFIGDACNCATSDDPCQAPADALSGRLCSGQGECECGRCSCLSGFSGPFCESCTRLPGQCDLDVCTASEDCVDMRGSSIGNATSFADIVRNRPGLAVCSDFPIRLTENVTLPYLIDGANATQCSTVVDSCTVTYYVAVRSATRPDRRVFSPLRIAKDRGMLLGVCACVC
eukprot:scpid49462/ scgid3434/ Integrin beta-5